MEYSSIITSRIDLNNVSEGDYDMSEIYPVDCFEFDIDRLLRAADAADLSSYAAEAKVAVQMMNEKTHGEMMSVVFKLARTLS